MTPPPGSPEDRLTRREFLGRSAKAGLAAGASAWLGWRLFDPRGPQSAEEISAAVVLPRFAMGEAPARMSIVTGDNRVRTVRRALEALGGIERYVRPGDRVVLKVNAAFASPPILSATTHPDLVAEVARLCLRAGAAEVRVTDNPIYDPRSCFALTGLADAARAAGAKLLLPRREAFAPVSLPGGRLLRDWPFLLEPFRGATKLIGLAPVKHHARSGASMCLKNWYGLLGEPRNVFHQDVHNLIKELALLVAPTLVVLDGTVSMMRNGPTGGSMEDLKPTRTMIVSTDAVAADAFGATLLGKKPDELPFIGLAAAAGSGTADYESLQPKRAETN